MTNDEFDAAYHRRWCESNDAAVAEISGFSYSLYSSDLLWPYRLKGRHAVPAQTREVAQHAIQFLQTDLEYEWPTNVRGIVPFFCLWGPAFYLVIGGVLLWVAVIEGGIGGLFLGGFGLLALAWTPLWLATYRSRAAELERLFKSGDFRVWPFLREADLARQQVFTAERNAGV
jgi:hypothetical protein